MKKAGLTVIIAVIVLASLAYFYNSGRASVSEESGISANESKALLEKEEISFSIPKKTPHFEASVPSHEDVLAGSPINVVINFNFDLSSISEISVVKEGVEYSEGSTILEENKLSMRKYLKNLSDGMYDVNYKACWPDNSCHTGNFQFAVDSSQKQDFADMRNKTEVAISLENIAFNPAKVIISPGTKVIWTNNESVVHYINTDPHAGHNYFPEQNSRAMAKGDSFSMVFLEPGIYPYHCSVHASVMKAYILVEENGR